MDMGSMGLVPAQTNLPPAVAKAERDVAILKRQARFTICLDDDGIESVLESDRYYSDTLPLIAVIGRTCTKGIWHEASLLEIGYRRARPYRRIRGEEAQTVLYDRMPFHQLDTRQQRLVYPKLLECLKIVLSETQSDWKSNEPWRLSDGQLVERGVTITVDKRDAWLYREFLREDSRYHQECFFRRKARAIGWRLRYCGNFRRYGTYPSSVVDVASSLYASPYREHPRRFEAWLRMMPRRRELLEMALLDLYNFRLRFDEEATLAYDESVRFPRAHYPLFFYQCPKQPNGKKGQHAAHCARFEIIYDRMFKPKHKLAVEPKGFKKRRLKGDVDVPF